MKKTLKLMVFTIFVLSITVLTLGSCDFDISGILGEYVCVHEWSEWDIVEQGDCKTPGLIQRECLNCGAIDEETTALKEHTEGVWIVDKEATCTEDGSKHTECSVCGTTISTEKILSAGGHSESDWIIDKEATCTEDGEKHTECTVCGITIAEEKINATGHTESDWIVDKKATCIEDGSKHTKCTVCGSIIAKTIHASEEHHKYENYNCIYCGVTSTDCFVFNYLYKSDSYSIQAKSEANLPSEISLPSSYNGKPVTSIGNYAFSYCTSLTNITIPDSVTSIGEYAFYNCSSLTSITIPDSVTSIGEGAFNYCNKLSSIEVNENNQYYKSIDGNLYTKDGKTLIQYAVGKKDTSFIIPDSVTSIGEYAFYNCSSLTSITIPDSVTSIGEGAFNYCNKLSSIEVNENNQYYKSIDGNLYTKDGKTLIQYAVGKKDTSFIIPDSVEFIGYAAFNCCSRLSSITIPNSVITVGEWAFANCTSLTSITIPDSVTSIGESAFVNCSRLTSITIPDSVTSIGTEAFGWCSRLSSIEVNENNQYYKSIDGNLYTKDGKTLVQYAVGKKDTSFTIPDSVEFIGDCAFYSCNSLISVMIGDSVTTIGSSAFSNCYSLTSIIIGDSVTSIGSGAFYNCDSLSNVYYGGTATEWKNISIRSYNDPLKNATHYYYSETEPTTEGNFWHWGENGEVVVWK